MRIPGYEQNVRLDTQRALSATRAAKANATISGAGSNAPSPGSASATNASAYRFTADLTIGRSRSHL
jgi:hypothetical protein